MFGESPLCEKCNLPFWDDHKSTCAKQTCKCKRETIPVLPMVPLYGWVCPSCGGGCAPGVNRCPCTPIPMNITCNPYNQQTLPCNPFSPYIQYYYTPGGCKVW